MLRLKFCSILFVREIYKLFFGQRFCPERSFFMEKFIIRKAEYQKRYDKDNENVICYVAQGVVLCR